MSQHGPSALDDPVVRDVVASVSEGVLFVDAVGTIVFASPRVSALLGYDPEQLLDRPIERLLAREDADRLAGILERASPSDPDGPPDRTACALVDSAGDRVSVDLAATVVDADGQRYRTLLVRERENDPARPGFDRVADAHSPTTIEIDGRRGDDNGVDRPRSDTDESRLEALYEASRTLHTATTRADAARISVDLVRTVLGRSYAAVWRFEPDERLLEPLAASEPVTASLNGVHTGATIPPIRSGTIEMELFRDGETRLLESYSSLDRPAHPELGLEERLVVPLGDSGLLTVGSTDGEAIDDALQHLIGILGSTIRTTFARIDAEEAVRHRSTAMESAMDGIAISDGDGELRYVNRALAALHGYDDPAELVGRSWQVLFPAEEADRIERESLPTVIALGHWRGETVGQRADGTRFDQEHSLTALDDGIVCIVRDATKRKTRERQLETLNDVARELMSVETPDGIARIGVAAIEDVLGFDVACVRLFDRESNHLECAALTPGAQELLEVETAYDLEATLAGRAFRDGEPILNVLEADDGTDAPSLFDRSSVHVPIGAHGVLSIVLPAEEPFDGSDSHLAKMLAMGIGAALVRAERTRLLRTQERKLRQQRDRLETLNRINAVNNEIVTGLVAATTREELDRTICERLVGSELYRSAWIGRIEGPHDRLDTPVGAGIDDSSLETIAELPLAAIAGGIVQQTVETGEMQVVRQYQIAEHDGADDDRAAEDVEATAAVPLRYGDRTVGVIVINSVREDVFTEEAVTGFESLGRLVGFANNALRSRELLLADVAVELEFTLRDPSVFYLRLTAMFGCRCEFERAIPIENGRVINYHTVVGADPAAVLEAADDDVHIESARALSERDDGFVLQTVTENSMTQLALELGTVVRSAVAEDGAGTVVVEAPQAADIRRIVAAFEREFDAIDLIAKREREQPVTTRQTFRDSVADRLTEKQCAALESAYFAGYYDWPRKITAEELAESIGISSSTLHQHLRRGNWSLLAAFFDETPRSEGAHSGLAEQ